MIAARCALLGILLGTVFISACASFSRPALERQHYLLEAERPETAIHHPPSDIVLAIRPVRLAPAFDAKPFVTITTQGRVEADFHNHFFLPPGEMLTSVLRSWLAESAIFAHVTDLSSLKTPDLVLEGYVSALYRNMSGGSGRAVCAVQFLLLRTGHGGAKVVFQQDYRQEVRLSNASAPELVRGWNQALTNILVNLETDLRQAVAGF